MKHPQILNKVKSSEVKITPLLSTQCINPANLITLPCETGLSHDSNQRKQTAGISVLSAALER